MTQSTSDLVPEKAQKKPDTTARRTRLREFQMQLVERMQAARAGAVTHVSQLGVQIGGMRCLLSLQEAGEIMAIGPITQVPLTQDWFLGLTNVRGTLISVIDLARFLGQTPTPIERESRVVAFSPNLSFNSGLLVSRVLGLRNVSEMKAQANAAENATPWSAQQYVDQDSQVWTELNLSLIVQDQRFLHVGL
jgi:twitching motility protein PilI